MGTFAIFFPLNMIHRFKPPANLFFGALVLAFWIKFNIVLFTYKPYTATKFYFPLFLLALGLQLWQHKKDPAWRDPALVFGVVFFVTLVLPLGYLHAPWDGAVYRQYALSLGSFFVLFVGAFFLSPQEKERLLWAVWVFCLFALAYVLAQYHGNLIYEPGHFRGQEAFERPYGILDDPAHSAGVYLLGLTITADRALRTKGAWWLCPFIPLFLYALWISRTLGAYLGVLGMAAFLPLLGLLFWKRPGVRPLGLGLFLFWCAWLPVLLLVADLYKLDFWGLREWTKGTEKFWSFELRIDLIYNALNVFFAHPFTGVGLANDFTQPIQYRYASSWDIYGKGLHLHTTPLAILANGGILAALPFGAFLFFTLRSYAQKIVRASTQRDRARALLWLAFFLGLQFLSLSLLMLYSVTYWFSLILPHLLAEEPRTS